ncbi:hypothetical protein HDU76_005507 [Blyttiomyces sp. JEL0837]|nr:hypothetical protein HDU76_005507 [Blyttiomyces sp. JEL0837]
MKMGLSTSVGGSAGNSRNGVVNSGYYNGNNGGYSNGASGNGFNKMNSTSVTVSGNGSTSEVGSGSGVWQNRNWVLQQFMLQWRPGLLVLVLDMCWLSFFVSYQFGFAPSWQVSMTAPWVQDWLKCLILNAPNGQNTCAYIPEPHLPNLNWIIPVFDISLLTGLYGLLLFMSHRQILSEWYELLVSIFSFTPQVPEYEMERGRSTTRRTNNDNNRGKSSNSKLPIPKRSSSLPLATVARPRKSSEVSMKSNFTYEDPNEPTHTFTTTVAGISNTTTPQQQSQPMAYPLTPPRSTSLDRGSRSSPPLPLTPMSLPLVESIQRQSMAAMYRPSHSRQASSDSTSTPLLSSSGYRPSHTRQASTDSNATGGSRIIGHYTNTVVSNPITITTPNLNHINIPISTTPTQFEPVGEIPTPRPRKLSNGEVQVAPMRPRKMSVSAASTNSNSTNGNNVIVHPKSSATMISSPKSPALAISIPSNTIRMNGLNTPGGGGGSASAGAISGGIVTAGVSANATTPISAGGTPSSRQPVIPVAGFNGNGHNGHGGYGGYGGGSGSYKTPPRSILKARSGSNASNGASVAAVGALNGSGGSNGSNSSSSGWRGSEDEERY